MSSVVGTIINVNDYLHIPLHKKIVWALLRIIAPLI